tara:strand:- start:12395 stop:13135 length:741 start_codon:yes stop_codon:yes gene_type:complete
MKLFNILTVYPEFFESFKNHGLIKKALDRDLIAMNILDIRDFTSDKHKRVDFKPFGGGPGMIIQYAPVKEALNQIESGRVILLSPQGKRLTQSKLIELSRENDVTFVCGRYEGVDERIVTNLIDEEISIGDYVLSGGEMPAACIVEGLTRLVPGVAENIESIENDSFKNNLLDYPQYTKPNHIDGLSVPEILLSGNHAEIKKWRRKYSLGMTYLKRPDLLKNVNLSKEDDRLLQEFIAERKVEESD